ncbi:MAG: PUR family DNA/RNA-binding protein [Crocinitomicaceae bacterium]|nr:PUR family DNA/RNA-binding protein [Crocinitomicaceae bacterium]
MDYDKNDEVYSKVVRAGKRTYFFDVKSTKGRDLYITMTESKKTFIDGREKYQKHKIFLYKEDFQKFSDGLSDVIEKIAELNSSGEYKTETYSGTEPIEEVSFEDL